MNLYTKMGIWFILSIAMGLILTISYWLLFPYNIEKIYDQNKMPILNEGHQVKAGGIVKWRAHYIIYKSGLRVEYSYFLEPATDSSPCEYKILLQGVSVTKAGEVDHVNASNVVPAEFKPCPYHVRIESVFHPNPLRTIDITAITEDFNIIK